MPHFQSLIDIFYNCDESFCTWLTEIVHSSNFQKAAIYVHNFQGSCDTTFTKNWLVRFKYMRMGLAIARGIFGRNAMSILQRNKILSHCNSWRRHPCGHPCGQMMCDACFTSAPSSIWTKTPSTWHMHAKVCSFKKSCFESDMLEQKSFY